MALCSSDGTTSEPNCTGKETIAGSTTEEKVGMQPPPPPSMGDVNEIHVMFTELLQENSQEGTQSTGSTRFKETPDATRSNSEWRVGYVEGCIRTAYA